MAKRESRTYSSRDNLEIFSKTASTRGLDGSNLVIWGGENGRDDGGSEVGEADEADDSSSFGCVELHRFRTLIAEALWLEHAENPWNRSCFTLNNDVIRPEEATSDDGDHMSMV
jgi:hypothetical protein